jgi:PadR family transcriptional regulator PadR
MAVFSVSTALLDAVVLSCVAKGDTYGYELTHNIQSVFSLSESTLYPVLRRLQKNQCLNTYDKPYMGRNRRYYHITEIGLQTLASYRAEWQQYKKQVDYFLNEEASS